MDSLDDLLYIASIDADLEDFSIILKEAESCETGHQMQSIV